MKSFGNLIGRFWIFGILFYMTTILSTNILASDSVNERGSLDWQRLKLESAMIEQAEKTLSSLLKRDEYAVLVSVKLKKVDDGAKNSNGAGAQTSDNNISKLGLDNDLANAIAKQNSGETHNIFAQIVSIDSTLIFDESVKTEKQELAKKIVGRVLEAQSGKKVQVKTEKAQLKDIIPPPAVVEPKKMEIKDWVLEFKNSIGVVAGSLILGAILFILGFLVLGKVGKIEAQKIGAFEAYVATQKEKADTESAVHENGSTDGKDAGHGASAESELVLSPEDQKEKLLKFQNLIQVNQSVASFLLKQWLRSGNETAIVAAGLISQSLNHDDLGKILPNLDIKIRKSWKNAAEQNATSSQQVQALRFLGEQILDSYLMPPPAVPQEKLERLMSLNEKQIVKLVQKNAEISCVLFNLLNLSQIAKVLDLLDEPTAINVSGLSAKLTEGDIVVQAGVLADNIDQMLNEQSETLSPFIERAADLIPRVNGAREKILFLSIAQSKSYQFLKVTAEKYFPSELVTKLPTEVLKSSLLKLNNILRAELVLSQPESSRTVFLSAIGEPGKKIRDMLDLEISEIEKNPRRKALLQVKGPVLWRDFISNLRKQLSTDEALIEQSRPILYSWIKEITQGEFDPLAQSIPEAGQNSQELSHEEAQAA